MNLTRDEARGRADLITVDSYEVSLDLTRGGEVFGSTTTVTFGAVAGSPPSSTPSPARCTA